MTQPHLNRQELIYRFILHTCTFIQKTLGCCPTLLRSTRVHLTSQKSLSPKRVTLTWLPGLPRFLPSSAQSVGPLNPRCGSTCSLVQACKACVRALSFRSLQRLWLSLPKPLIHGHPSLLCRSHHALNGSAPTHFLHPSPSRSPGCTLAPRAELCTRPP